MKWLAAIVGGLVAGGVIGALVGYVTYAPDPSPDAWDFGPGLNAIGGVIVGAPVGALALPLLVWIVSAIGRTDAIETP